MAGCLGSVLFSLVAQREGRWRWEKGAGSVRDMLWTTGFGDDLAQEPSCVWPMSCWRRVGCGRAGSHGVVPARWAGLRPRRRRRGGRGRSPATLTPDAGQHGSSADGTGATTTDCTARRRRGPDSWAGGPASPKTSRSAAWPTPLSGPRVFPSLTRIGPNPNSSQQTGLLLAPIFLSGLLRERV